MSAKKPTSGSIRAVKRTLALARPHLRGQGWLMTGGVAMMLIEVVMRVAEPWPLKIVIDAVTVSLGATEGAAAGQSGASIGLLVSCGILLLGFVGVRAIAQYGSTVVFALVGSRVATRLRSRVFSHLQSLGQKYHSRAQHGDNVQRLVGDVGRLQEVAVSAGLPLVGNVITLAVLSVVMLVMDPLLAVVVLGSAVAYAIMSRSSGRKIVTVSRRTRKSEGQIANAASETFGAIRVVQAYGLEQQRGRTFEHSNERALGQGVASRRLAAGLERGTDVIVGLALAIVLVVGGWRVIEGALTPGDLVIFTTYLKLALRPLKDLAKFTGRIARALASGERVAEVLDERPEIADRPWARPLGDLAGGVRGGIEFDRLDVDDGHGRPLFRDLSFRVEPGSTVCVLGPSGSGKSTLAGLLTRVTDPVSGRLAIDGVDVRDATLASLRGSVSSVLQEAVLFATSVRENIQCGRLGASDREVEEAARRALADDFIRELPDGYDTELGDRGATLSGGQRQRIAIARALLRDAPIVILDEATTGLDPESKERVSESIDALTMGRTTISITHDPVAIRTADRVLWIEDGQVAEDGAPDELIARSDSRLSSWLRTAAPALVGGAS